MCRNRDVYIAQGEAANNYCGRVLVGLPVNHENCLVSYADFIPVTVKESLNGGVDHDEYLRQQNELNIKVDARIDKKFGAENLARSSHQQSLLRIGLASHLRHQKSYYKRVPSQDPSTFVKLLPDNSPLRRTALFTCSRVTALSKYVSIAMPWEDRFRYFKQPTGIPPHSLLLGHFWGLKPSFEKPGQKLNELPIKSGEMLDERDTHGGLTLDQIVQAVEQAPQLSGISKDVTHIKQMMSKNNEHEHEDVGAQRRIRQTARFMREFKHGKNDYRRVPRTWTFSTLGLQPLYVYWHSGDEEKNPLPHDFLERRDVAHINKKAPAVLSEIRRVMTLIDKHAETQGRRIKNVMTPAEANSLYSCGEDTAVEVVSPTTKMGRERVVSRVNFCTAIKCLHKKRRTN